VYSLRKILANLRSPEQLDSHPWTNSLTVKEAIEQDPSLREKGRGTQLALALGQLFRQLLPTTPPQDGKRLDTRWGRFGILASNYFAPLLYGRLYPHSLREAWRKIDQALLLFVYSVPAEQLKPEQVEAYRLVGDELDMPANSTISDWHREGLQDLTELFVNHEQYLSNSSGQPSILFSGDGNGRPYRRPKTQPLKSPRRFVWRMTTIVLLLVLLAALSFLAVQVWGIYNQLHTVRNDVTSLESLKGTSLQLATLEQAGPLLDRTHQDVETLRGQVSPWLWLTPGLGWVPVYGGDLKYSGDLLELASNLTQTASQTCQIALPIWQSLHQNQNDLKADQLTGMLLKAQPSLLQSQATLQEAIKARQRINIEELSATPHSWLTRLDPYLSTFNDALSLSLSLPNLLGASQEGPKTYLILVQNEDELRATGGFITAVGKVVVWNGKLISWNVVDSYSVDDINKAYPPAPWQMQSFMNVPIAVFQDANWSPDYPTTVLWAEYLYAYTNSFSVNGVVAIDQHVLKTLLSVTGPLYVSEINTTVTSDNVESVMRIQKVPPPQELLDPNWYRKHFLNPIASAILDRVLSGHGLSWEQLLRAMLGELDQRHILVKLDDPTVSYLLAERGWDGAVSRTAGDFLMSVDTNVGYNKTNAVVSENLAYDVDLTNLSTPTSNLAVFHHNAAQGPNGICDQRPAGVDVSTLDYWYAINRCYYNYLRVYVPAGTQLKSATPHAVTRDEMVMLDQDVPARVDSLDDNLPGLQGFGTLELVPMGASLETDFQFNLPAGVLQIDPIFHGLIYQLKVQKQAGTRAIPITVRVHLPHGSQISSASPGGYTQTGDNLLFDLTLTTDVNIRIQFHP
jgi:Protein of unknown function (DUF4012)